MLTKDEVKLFYRKTGELIREARILSKLSQEEVAGYLGFVSRVSIVNIERGKQKVQLHTLFEIATLFKVAVQDLIPDRRSLKNNISIDLLEKMNREVSKEIPDDINTMEKMKDFLIDFSSKEAK